MNESFFHILKDGLFRLRETWGKKKFYVFLLLISVSLIFAIYFAGGGLFNRWHQWRVDSQIENLTQAAQIARAERDQAELRANYAEEKANGIVEEKTKLETERNELLLKYRDLREKSEAARLAYEKARNAGLRLDGLTNQRFRDLSNELDNLDQ